MRDEYLRSVGRSVAKASGRPFKSGAKVNTVSGLCCHWRTRNLCYTFLEDDSIVECFRCKLL